MRILTLLFVLNSVTILSGCNNQSQPEIILEVDTPIDLGRVVQGQSAFATFNVSAGHAKLSNLQVKTGCGCTRANIDKTELSPGESATVELWLDTKHKRREFSVQVSILAKADGEPVTARTMCNAYVVPLAGLDIRPSEITADVVPGESVNFDFRVKINEPESELVLQDLKTPEWMSFQRGESDATSFRFSINATVPKRGGVVSEQLELVLSIGDQSITRTIPVVLNVDSPIVFSRRALVKQTSAGQPFQYSVDLESVRDVEIEGVEILQLESTPDGLVDAAISEKKGVDGKGYQLDLSGSLSAEVTSCRGAVTVRVQLDSEQYQDLRLPFVLVTGHGL